MSNIRTLKPFTSGHDPRRNTKGRPKGGVSSFQEILERELAKKVSIGNGEKVTMETAILMRIIHDARMGKISAMKLFMDYRYGKPIRVCPKCNYLASRRARKEYIDMAKENLKETEKEIIAWEKEWKKNK